MAGQRRYNSSRRIGGHNWKHSYQVAHIKGDDGLSLCPRETASHITPSSSSRSYCSGEVVCMWCQWIADAQLYAMPVAA